MFLKLKGSAVRLAWAAATTPSSRWHSILVASRKGHLDGILMLGQLQNAELHAGILHWSLWSATRRLLQRLPNQALQGTRGLR